MTEHLNNIVVFILIGINVLVSLKGFQDRTFFNNYKFQMHEVVQNKQYYRIITASFLHADFMHLFLNMYTLFIFLPAMEVYGIFGYLLIYFGAVILGDLLTIFLYKRDSMYSSIGASGGVSGITFALAMLFPNLELRLFGIIPMYFWIYVFLFMIYSIYGMKNQLGNIGHSAHLGGAIAGIIGAIAIFPKESFASTANAFVVQLPTLGILLIPIVALVYVIKKER